MHEKELNLASDREVAVVTGAGSGLGRALAAKLAARGVYVVITDIDGDSAATAAAAVRSAGGQAEARVLDVRDAEAVADTVASVDALYGRLDWMVNNAGILVFGEAADITLEQWQQVIEVNLFGVVYGSRAAVPRMVRRGAGRIVNIASVAGVRAFPLCTPYTASKHAVVGFSLSLRAEVAAAGVGVTVACPGFITTSIFDNAEVNGPRLGRLVGSIPVDLMTADRAACRIIGGARRNRAVLVFPWWARLSWFVGRVAPDLAAIVDGHLARKMRKRWR